MRRSARACRCLKKELKTPGNPAKLRPGVVVTNVGDKPISAIFLRWRYISADNKATDGIEFTDYAVSGSLMQPREKTKMPSGSIVMLQPGSKAAVQTIEVSCETVVFQGGGFWGNITLPDIRDQKAMRAGFKMERGRLLDVYKKEGVDGLLKELNRPVVE